MSIRKIRMNEFRAVSRFLPSFDVVLIDKVVVVVVVVVVVTNVVGAFVDCVESEISVRDMLIMSELV